MSSIQPPRTARVAPLIQAQLGELLSQQVQDPRIGLVTVTEVSLSPDLKNAKVFVSILGDAEQVARSLRGLAAAAAFLRTQLARRLQLRHVPQLTFRHDTSLDQAERIDRLLRHADAPGHQAAAPAADSKPLPVPQTHRSGRAGQLPPVALPPPRRRAAGRKGGRRSQGTRR